MRLVLTPTGWAPFDAEAKTFHRDLCGGEPFTAHVIEIEPLHDRDMIEHRRIMAIINIRAMEKPHTILCIRGIRPMRNQ